MHGSELPANEKMNLLPIHIVFGAMSGENDMYSKHIWAA